MVSLMCTLHTHRDDVNCCVFSGSLLATCSADKTICVFCAGDFSEMPFSPLSGHGYGVHCCCFSPCGRYLASCSTDATTLLWDMETGEIEAVLEHPGRSPVRVCAFSPDSSYLMSGGSDGSTALWDFTSRTLHKSGSVSDTSIVACSFTPCSQLFITGSSYGDLRLWDLDMNHLHAEKNAHDLGVSCCQFAPQMKKDADGCVQFRLASCGQDSLLKIWIVSRVSSADVKMQLAHTLTAQSAPVLSCAYSADGQMLVSGSVDKTVTVYQANEGILLYTLNQHDRYVTACAFSPTGPIIATGSMDKSVNIWRVEDGASAHGKSPDESASVSSNEGSRFRAHSRLMVSQWSEEDVLSWLREEGLEAVMDAFRSNNMDGEELLSLTKETLSSDLHIESLGVRSKVMKKIEELKMSSVCNGTPDEYLCPITREIMRDPVIAADGYSYEREAIESWINTKNRTSPMTNLPLQTTLLTPNRTLKMAICRWTTNQ
ncbi:WD repeat, SAM and U-box domain-containing protein 1 isoform X1 [Triplophysa rosa]|uniref:WD repeat, SAM and U-box domain-containing protein 1 n=1 Tax=Triplophysa rosa TaxID=992332 RepID=A0A9W7WTB4_TRIRA|nr:WD repeat, SAM and U-box domain-containing protein 1 isoform X1 [Triplophysa rosa]KAI7807924.1 WD repeat [Triplophysa rosa]